MQDNKEKYQAMPGITEFQLKQLLKVDKELERKFGIQQKVKNKNDEMVNKKIDALSKKKILKDYLFKKISA